MPSGQLGLPDENDELYNNERAVLSIQDIYIKEEQGEKSSDVLILDGIEGNLLGDAVTEYNLTNEEILNQNNICMSAIEAEQGLIAEFNKMPVELAIPMKPDDVKVERSHFVKFVMKEGKHMKVWECGICAKEFGHQYTLMRHLPTHTDERKFQCNTCGKAFRQMSTLSQHRAIHSTDRPYICEICRKTFNRVSTLISHRKTHTGHKPHRCHLCNKAFHQKGNLRNHIFTHTNERPYKCDVCGKGFNQMSNLMCHKLKAHHRADKPRYSCQVCGKDFPKRMALRNHEQYQHGVAESSSTTSAQVGVLPTPPALEHRPDGHTVDAKLGTGDNKYSNGVLVEPIKTDAMKMAIQTKQTPFALLRPLNGIPVLVRVLSAGEKQMLVPATADDLRKHGQITIHSGNPIDSSSDNPHPSAVLNPEDLASPAGNGSTVQIKIPVVATVVQRCATDGTMCMSVQSPGPKESTMDGYVVESEDKDGLQHEIQMVQHGSSIGSGGHIITDTLLPEDDPLLMQDAHVQEIHYLDERGNIISEEEYNAKTEMLQFETNGYTLLPTDNYVGQTIDLDGNIAPIGPIGPMAPNNNITLSHNVEDVQLGEDNMNLTQIDNETVYGVQSALEAIDKVRKFGDLSETLKNNIGQINFSIADNKNNSNFNCINTNINIDNNLTCRNILSSKFTHKNIVSDTNNNITQTGEPKYDDINEKGEENLDVISKINIKTITNSNITDKQAFNYKNTNVSRFGVLENNIVSFSRSSKQNNTLVYSKQKVTNNINESIIHITNQSKINSDINHIETCTYKNNTMEVGNRQQNVDNYLYLEKGTSDLSRKVDNIINSIVINDSDEMNNSDSDTNSDSINLQKIDKDNFIVDIKSDESFGGKYQDLSKSATRLFKNEQSHTNQTIINSNNKENDGYMDNSGKLQQDLVTLRERNIGATCQDLPKSVTFNNDQISTNKIDVHNDNKENDSFIDNSENSDQNVKVLHQILKNGATDISKKKGNRIRGIILSDTNKRIPNTKLLNPINYKIMNQNGYVTQNISKKDQILNNCNIKSSKKENNNILVDKQADSAINYNFIDDSGQQASNISNDHQIILNQNLTMSKNYKNDRMLDFKGQLSQNGIIKSYKKELSEDFKEDIKELNYNVNSSGHTLNFIYEFQQSDSSELDIEEDNNRETIRKIISDMKVNFLDENNNKELKTQESTLFNNQVSDLNINMEYKRTNLDSMGVTMQENVDLSRRFEVDKNQNILIGETMEASRNNNLIEMANIIDYDTQEISIKKYANKDSCMVLNPLYKTRGRKNKKYTRILTRFRNTHGKENLKKLKPSKSKINCDILQENTCLYGNIKKKNSDQNNNSFSESKQDQNTSTSSEEIIILNNSKDRKRKFSQNVDTFSLLEREKRYKHLNYGELDSYTNNCMDRIYQVDGTYSLTSQESDLSSKTNVSLDNNKINQTYCTNQKNSDKKNEDQINFTEPLNQIYCVDEKNLENKNEDHINITEPENQTHCVDEKNSDNKNEDHINFTEPLNQVYCIDEKNSDKNEENINFTEPLNQTYCVAGKCLDDKNEDLINFTGSCIDENNLDIKNKEQINFTEPVNQTHCVAYKNSEDKNEDQINFIELLRNNFDNILLNACLRHPDKKYQEIVRMPVNLNPEIRKEDETNLINSIRANYEFIRSRNYKAHMDNYQNEIGTHKCCKSCTETDRIIKNLEDMILHAKASNISFIKDVDNDQICQNFVDSVINETTKDDVIVIDDTEDISSIPSKIPIMDDSVQNNIAIVHLEHDNERNDKRKVISVDENNIQKKIDKISIPEKDSYQNTIQIDNTLNVSTQKNSNVDYTMSKEIICSKNIDNKNTYLDDHKDSAQNDNTLSNERDKKVENKKFCRQISTISDLVKLKRYQTVNNLNNINYEMVTEQQKDSDQTSDISKLKENISIGSIETPKYNESRDIVNLPNPKFISEKKDVDEMELEIPNCEIGIIDSKDIIKSTPKVASKPINQLMTDYILNRSISNNNRCQSYFDINEPMSITTLESKGSDDFIDFKNSNSIIDFFVPNYDYKNIVLEDVNGISLKTDIVEIEKPIDNSNGFVKSKNSFEEYNFVEDGMYLKYDDKEILDLSETKNATPESNSKIGINIISVEILEPPNIKNVNVSEDSFTRCENSDLNKYSEDLDVIPEIRNDYDGNSPNDSSSPQCFGLKPKSNICNEFPEISDHQKNEKYNFSSIDISYTTPKKTVRNQEYIDNFVTSTPTKIDEENKLPQNVAQVIFESPTQSDIISNISTEVIPKTTLEETSQHSEIIDSSLTPTEREYFLSKNSCTKNKVTKTLEDEYITQKLSKIIDDNLIDENTNSSNYTNFMENCPDSTKISNNLSDSNLFEPLNVVLVARTDLTTANNWTAESNEEKQNVIFASNQTVEYMNENINNNLKSVKFIEDFEKNGCIPILLIPKSQDLDLEENGEQEFLIYRLVTMKSTKSNQNYQVPSDTIDQKVEDNITKKLEKVTKQYLSSKTESDMQYFQNFMITVESPLEKSTIFTQKENCAINSKDYKQDLILESNENRFLDSISNESPEVYQKSTILDSAKGKYCTKNCEVCDQFITFESKQKRHHSSPNKSIDKELVEFNQKSFGVDSSTNVNFAKKCTRCFNFESKQICQSFKIDLHIDEEKDEIYQKLNYFDSNNKVYDTKNCKVCEQLLELNQRRTFTQYSKPVSEISVEICEKSNFTDSQQNSRDSKMYEQISSLKSNKFCASQNDEPSDISSATEDNNTRKFKAYEEFLAFETNQMCVSAQNSTSVDLSSVKNYQKSNIPNCAIEENDIRKFKFCDEFLAFEKTQICAPTQNSKPIDLSLTKCYQKFNISDSNEENIAKNFSICEQPLAFKTNQICSLTQSSKPVILSSAKSYQKSNMPDFEVNQICASAQNSIAFETNQICLPIQNAKSIKLSSAKSHQKTNKPDSATEENISKKFNGCEQLLAFEVNQICAPAQNSIAFEANQICTPTQNFKHINLSSAKDCHESNLPDSATIENTKISQLLPFEATQICAPTQNYIAFEITKICAPDQNTEPIDLSLAKNYQKSYVSDFSKENNTKKYEVSEHLVFEPNQIRTSSQNCKLVNLSAVCQISNVSNSSNKENDSKKCGMFNQNVECSTFESNQLIDKSLVKIGQESNVSESIKNDHNQMVITKDMEPPTFSILSSEIDEMDFLSPESDIYLSLPPPDRSYKKAKKVSPMISGEEEEKCYLTTNKEELFTDNCYKNRTKAQTEIELNLLALEIELDENIKRAKENNNSTPGEDDIIFEKYISDKYIENFDCSPSSVINSKAFSEAADNIRNISTENNITDTINHFEYMNSIDKPGEVFERNAKQIEIVGRNMMDGRNVTNLDPINKSGKKNTIPINVDRKIVCDKKPGLIIEATNKIGHVFKKIDMEVDEKDFESTDPIKKTREILNKIEPSMVVDKKVICDIKSGIIFEPTSNKIYNISKKMDMEVNEKEFESTGPIKNTSEILNKIAPSMEINKKNICDVKPGISFEPTSQIGEGFKKIDIEVDKKDFGIIPINKTGHILKKTLPSIEVDTKNICGKNSSIIFEPTNKIGNVLKRSMSPTKKTNNISINVATSIGFHRENICDKKSAIILQPPNKICDFFKKIDMQVDEKYCKSTDFINKANDILKKITPSMKADTKNICDLKGDVIFEETGTVFEKKVLPVNEDGITGKKTEIVFEPNEPTEVFREFFSPDQNSTSPDLF